jgi:hypothetical protein
MELTDAYHHLSLPDSSFSIHYIIVEDVIDGSTRVLFNPAVRKVAE